MKNQQCGCASRENSDQLRDQLSLRCPHGERLGPYIDGSKSFIYECTCQNDTNEKVDIRGEK